MSTLITGSEGYIGQSLRKYCTFKDSQVYNLDASKSSIFRKELTDLQNFKFKTLIHCAAIIGESNINSDNYYSNNCAKYEGLLRSNKFDKIIYLSSGDFTDDNLNINPLSVYASTKLEGEYITKRSGVPYKIIRPHMVVGACPGFHTNRTLVTRPRDMFWQLAISKIKGQKVYIDKSYDYYEYITPLEYISIEIGRPKIKEVSVKLLSPVNLLVIFIDLCEKYNIEYELHDTKTTYKHPRTPFNSNWDSINSTDYCMSEFENYLTCVRDIYENINS